MKLRISSLLPLLLMLSLAAVTLWLRVLMEPEGGGSSGRHRHDPDAVVESFQLTSLDAQGAPQYVMTAARMVHFGDDDSTELASPRMRRRAEGPEITITADRGTVTREGDEAFFHDNVIVVRAATADREELRLQTDYLHVLTEKKIARTDRPVTITEGKSVLNGVGMELDEEARKFTLFSKVRGSFDQIRK